MAGDRVPTTKLYTNYAGIPANLPMLMNFFVLNSVLKIDSYIFVNSYDIAR